MVSHPSHELNLFKNLPASNRRNLTAQNDVCSLPEPLFVLRPSLTTFHVRNLCLNRFSRELSCKAFYLFGSRRPNLDYDVAAAPQTSWWSCMHIYARSHTYRHENLHTLKLCACNNFLRLKVAVSRSNRGAY